MLDAIAPDNRQDPAQAVRPGLCAVPIGPTIEGAHSPQERLDVESVGRFYEVVRRILGRLAAQ